MRYDRYGCTIANADHGVFRVMTVVHGRTRDQGAYGGVSLGYGATASWVRYPVHVMGTKRFLTVSHGIPRLIQLFNGLSIEHTTSKLK